MPLRHELVSRPPSGTQADAGVLRWLMRAIVVLTMILLLVVYVRADVVGPALIWLALLAVGETVIGHGVRRRGGTLSSETRTGFRRSVRRKPGRVRRGRSQAISDRRAPAFARWPA